MRMLTSGRSLLLATLLAAAWSVAGPAAPQPPQRPREVELPDDVKAKLEAFMKAQKDSKGQIPDDVKAKIEAFLKAKQEKAGKPEDGKPAESPPAEGKKLLIQPSEGKIGQKPENATYHFEMRNKPWKDVIEWLADKVNMPFTGINLPTGTFTFIPPKGAMYTVPQIIDIINEGMLSHEATQKYILVRRTTMFTIVPASDKIDPYLVPEVSQEELERRGNTEVVRVRVSLKKQDVTTAAREYQQLMSSFGTLVALTDSNQLSLQDAAGNLRTILRLIREVEKDEAGQAQTFSHQCVYIRARDAEKALKELLGDTAAEEANARRGGFGDRGQGGPGGFQFPGGFTPGGFTPGGTRGGPGGGPSSGGPGGMRGGDTQNRRVHRISCDEVSNKVFVTGPPDKLAQARAILKEIDVSTGGSERIIPGKVMLKTYMIPAGNAQELSRLLSEKYRNSTTVRISAVGNASILVMAMAHDQMDIATFILEASEKGIKNEVLAINGDATAIFGQVSKFFGTTTGGGPLMELDTNRNAIIIRGTPEQVADVKKFLAETGEDSNSSSTMRVIQMKNGGGAAIAEELQRLLPRFLDNPINLIKPEPPKPAPQPVPDRDRDSREEEEDDEEELQAAPEAFEPADTTPAAPQVKKDDKQPGKKPSAPVTITTIGDRVIIRSDDPEALKAAQELIRIITSNTGTGDFEVIQLNNASAVDTATLLEQMYNPQQQRRGGDTTNPFAMMFGGFGGRGSTTQPAAATEPRIRVVADPNTNSIMVKANAVDMLAIKRLLRESIDAADPVTGAAVVRTWVMPPLKYANASEVVVVLQNVYRDFMNASGGFGGSFGSSRGGPSPFSSGGFRPPVDSSGNRRQAQLSIGVDDRSNSLVLSCNEKMYKDIKQLVDQLEEAAKDSTKTVKVVPLVGIDPAVAQMAIEAIQGRTTSSSGFNGFGSSRFGGGTSPFGGGSSPFGTPFGGGMSSPFGGSTSPFGGFRGSFGTPGGSSGTPGSGIMIPSGGGFGTPGGSFRGTYGTPGGSFGPPSGGTGGPSRFGPGGGGGGPGGSRGGRDQSRGPDFFEYRVTDDPQVPRFFDPRESSVVHLDWSFAPTDGIHPAQLVAYQDKGKLPPGGEPVRGPRSPVSAQALPDLGAIIISGNNPADVEEILRVLKLLSEINKPAQVVVRVFPMEQADATSVTNTLLQYYSRVNPSPSGNIPLRSGTTPGIFGGAAGAQVLPQPSGSLVMIPLVRQNAILVAAPEVRMKDIEAEIRRLDVGLRPAGQARPIQLRKAPAARVADILTQFYTTRYGNDQNQIRVTSEATTNTIFVQASDADFQEIRSIIDAIDTADSNVIHEMRIYKLRSGVAEELANLINFTLSQGTVSPSLAQPRGTTGLGTGGVTAPTTPTTIGGLTTPTGTTGLTGAGLTGAVAQGIATKGITLRLLGREGSKPVESGNLEDARIVPDARTNSLIIVAPAKTATLIESLIRELDILPAARAEINVILLKRADATAMGTMLQQLFLGTGATGVTGTQGGLNTLQAQRPQLSLGGTTPDGAPLTDLRITVDPRTNSLIVAGSPSDLLAIEAITRRLDDADVQRRQTEIYHLRNSTAADIATTLTNYVNGVLTVFSRNNQLPVAAQLEREIVIIPESISNKLLISATPPHFAEIMRLIHELDAQPPQVVIQVLIAEVDHTATEEFGMEVGLQSPVLFSRSILPGLTVNSTTNPAANPGFLFNTTAPLGNNPFVNPGIVGFQGINNLGVNRVGANGVGGFVFSASSNSFNLLLRALKTQGRLDVLSRPQIMTLDNQTAQLNVGQDFPIVLGQTITATGLATNDIDYRSVGVILTVTPRISPDGTVLMRVRPEVSSIIPTQVPVGNGVLATAFNVQAIETTVVAHDGETVGLGGLITKRDEKRENKIPFLGDLKYIGAAFRYRSQFKERRELIVILTPHIVRNRHDAAKILSEESKRVDWVLGDVLRMHGTAGMDPILQNYQQGLLQQPCPPQQPYGPQPSLIVPTTPPQGGLLLPGYPQGMPGLQQPMPLVPQAQPPATQQVPPRPLPPTTGAVPPGGSPHLPAGGAAFGPQTTVPQPVIRNVAAAPVSPQPFPTPAAPQPAVPALIPPPGTAPTQTVAPAGYQPGMMPQAHQASPKADPGKETKWNLFQRKK